VVEQDEVGQDAQLVARGGEGVDDAGMAGAGHVLVAAGPYVRDSMSLT
jgi:hypothetical protein